jgi:hypothetical protein
MHFEISIVKEVLHVLKTAHLETEVGIVIHIATKDIDDTLG